jgi:hypothetical protein
MTRAEHVPVPGCCPAHDQFQEAPMIAETQDPHGPAPLGRPDASPLRFRDVFTFEPLILATLITLGLALPSTLHPGRYWLIMGLWMLNSRVCFFYGLKARRTPWLWERDRTPQKYDCIDPHCPLCDPRDARSGVSTG